MNKVALATFSYFDVGSGNGSDTEPERFYHGFVLGLIAERAGIYEIRSNRESGSVTMDLPLKGKCFDRTGKAGGMIVSLDD